MYVSLWKIREELWPKNSQLASQSAVKCYHILIIMSALIIMMYCPRTCVVILSERLNRLIELKDWKMNVILHFHIFTEIGHWCATMFILVWKKGKTFNEIFWENYSITRTLSAIFGVNTWQTDYRQTRSCYGVLFDPILWT